MEEKGEMFIRNCHAISKYVYVCVCGERERDLYILLDTDASSLFQNA